jgi:hypothetical protein
MDQVSRRAAIVTPKRLIENPIDFDDALFYKSLEDGVTPIPPSTAWTHKWRVTRMDVIAALNKPGTLRHQAVIIHDTCTFGPKAGIGIALGILGSPKQHESVVDHLFQDTFEVLHCDRVLRRNNA